MSLRLAVAALAFVLPWLNPHAAGPSTWVGPWLFSAICAAVAFAAGPAGAPNVGLGALLGGLAGWGVLRSGLTPQTLALAASCAIVWLTAALLAGRPRDEALVRVVAIAWMAAAVVSTAAALLQYFGLAEHFEPWVNVSAAGEAFANLRQRNQFASLTVIGAAALLWLGALGGRRWLAFAAIGWLQIGNAATTSRTGLLELLVLGVLTWRWTGWRSRRMQLWLFGLTAYAVAALALPLLAQTAGVAQSPLWARVTGADPCGSRLVLWSNVLHLIAQRPWLGWGWGELDYAHFTTLYTGPRFCDILDNAHNLPLHLGVELGVPAAVVMCLAVARAMWRAGPWSESDAARQMAWTVVMVLVVHSMLEYPLWYGPFQMALGVSVGLLWPPGAAGRKTTVWSAGFAAMVGSLALAAAGYAAWDYHRASQVYLPQEQRAPEWRNDPLARLGGSWLFRDQVQFAELTLTPLTRDNAEWMYRRADRLLHYSPEPRVIEPLIESAVLLHRDTAALAQLARFQAAFPQAHAEWAGANHPSLPR